VAKPPAGSSLLFGALADSGRTKQRKNGSYRMVLEGVDEIDWFTDRPDRVEGTWKPQKLLRKWDKYFASSEPNAQATVEVGEQRELFTFEMLKPKMESGKMVFGVKPLSDSSKDKITGLKNMEMSDISLFIDPAIPPLGMGGTIDPRPPCFPDCRGEDLSGMQFEGTNLVDGNFTDAKLVRANLRDSIMVKTNLTGANLTNANLHGALLNQVNLTGANFKGAKLNAVNWEIDSICPDGTKHAFDKPCTDEQLLLQSPCIAD
jgi:hypothetical protein